MRLETLEKSTKNCRSFVSVYKNLYGMKKRRRGRGRKGTKRGNSSRVRGLVVIDAQLKLQ